MSRTITMFGPVGLSRRRINPEIAKAIKISNRKRGQQDDSAHGIIHRAFTAIRLKDIEELEQNMTQLVNHGFVRRNLETSHFPYRGQFPDLQGAMPALLLEMAVFSMPGEVELLPAMPPEFSEGELKGVWLYTWAKLEMLQWNASGIVAVVTSNNAQTLTLRCRRQLKTISVDGVKIPVNNGCAQYHFKAGETVTVSVDF